MMGKGPKERVASTLLRVEQQALAALVKRLGIGPEIEVFCRQVGLDPENSELVTWAFIGMKLARGQAEFTGAPVGPGRPVDHILENINVKRALFIEQKKAEIFEREGKKASTVELLKEYAGKHDLFKTYTGIQTYQRSVSIGNTDLRKVRDEFENYKAEIASNPE